MGTLEVNGSSEFLNSWKEIAEYLNRGVRTAQRWERELGMPVRRPRGKARSAVLAVRSEIDRWLSSCPLPVQQKSRAPAPGSRTLDQLGREFLLTHIQAGLVHAEVGLMLGPDQAEKSRRILGNVHRAYETVLKFRSRIDEDASATELNAGLARLKVALDALSRRFEFIPSALLSSQREARP